MESTFPARRIVAGSIALIGTATFALQIVLSTGKSGGLLAALLVLSRFFTILTNAAVTVAMVRIAAGWHADRRVMLALVSAIAIVALVYHTVLAQLQTFTGLDAVTDFGFHTAIPALTVAWWLLFAERDLPWRDVVWVLPWPIVYCAVALVRGGVSGIYPYPFIDLPEIGPATLVLNVIGLTLAFLVVGAAFIGMGRMLATPRDRA